MEFFDLSHRIVKIMVASAQLCFNVRVVGLSHGTVVFQEFIVTIHPAALATIAAVVLVAYSRVFEFRFVVATAFARSECAVDTLLL